MAIILDGTNGITSPGGDSNNSLTTPIVKSATTLSLQTNGSTTAVTIDASQNMGIGTISPQGKLQVSSSSASDISSPFNLLSLALQNTNSTVNNYSSIANLNSAGAANAAINFINIGQSAYPNNAGAIAFSTYAGSGAGGTEKMRIDPSGNVMIGTTSSSGLLTVKASTTLHTAEFFGSGGSYEFVEIINVQNSGFTAMRFLNNNYATAVGSISCSTSATSYNTSSDYRLKENIAPMTGALDKVTQLKPVTYKWKSDGSDGQGFIAHELAEVVPDCVSGEKDAVETYTDEEGNEQTRIKPQGIDTSFLVATLTSALQEAHGLIKGLEARLVVLESK